MKLLFLHGLPGVGKMTVARELEKLTKFKIFHNHLAVDLATAVFEFGSQPFVQLRETIWLEMFALAVREKQPGMIFTFAPDRTVTSAFIAQVRQIVKTGGGELFFVELTCAEFELERRLVEPSRQRFGKLSSLTEFRELNRAGAFVTPGIPGGSLAFDTTKLAASEAASRIVARLGFDTIGFVTASKLVQGYTEWASTYDEDRNLTRDLDQVVTERFLGSSRWGSIIEIGCGTGKNTGLLARVAGRVLALDLNEAMISRARAKLSDCDNVTFRTADLREPWPGKTQSADLIVCNLVLEHLEELSFVFSEAARCLVSGGKFFVSELHPYRQYQGMKANFHRADQTIQIEAFVHNVSDFLAAANESGLALDRFTEWWHEEDEQKPPRLAAFEFKKIR